MSLGLYNATTLNHLGPLVTVLLSLLYGWFLVYSPDFMTIVSVVYWVALSMANATVALTDKYAFGNDAKMNELRADGESVGARMLQC